MFCCFGVPAAYAPIDTCDTLLPASKALGYPASKRSSVRSVNCHETKKPIQLVQSAGNALMEYDTESMSDLLRVTVPEGCWSGQVINVSYAHDASKGVNNVMPVQIPFGCTSGSTFLVKIPPTTSTTDATKDMTPDHDLKLKEDHYGHPPLKADSSSGIVSSASGREFENAII